MDVMEVIPEEAEYENENENEPVVMGPPSQRKIIRATSRKVRSNPDVHPENSALTSAPRTVPSLLTQQEVPITFSQLETVRVLGEGAFGEVVLVVDRNDQNIAAAVKRIELKGVPEDTIKIVRKEALIQRALTNHPNVLRYISMRVVNNEVFELFLEYADGGELFDQIEPDHGMQPMRAQFYFRQLIDGIEYIHTNGICHRDIKPENLLITKKHVLKISDFGMATVFQHKNKERLLSTRCGTLPYAAPEIIRGPYHATPVDVWSCGVVLVTVLVGELPWEGATEDCIQFTDFARKNDNSHRPWCRFDTTELSIVRMMLCEDVSKRATIARVRNHPWFTENLSHQNSRQRPIPENTWPVNGSVRSNRLDGLVPSSQPAGMYSLKNRDSVYLMHTDRPRQALPNASFSQPVTVDLLSKSQLGSSQASYAHPCSTLVRRMTRFCVVVSVYEALQAVENAARVCDCEIRLYTAHCLHITSLKNPELAFVATVYEMIYDGSKVLVDFRRSKGDGIEFKRMFMEFKKLLANIICKDSILWLEKQGLLAQQPTEDEISQSQVGQSQPLIPAPEALHPQTQSESLNFGSFQ